MQPDGQRRRLHVFRPSAPFGRAIGTAGFLGRLPDRTLAKLLGPRTVSVAVSGKWIRLDPGADKDDAAAGGLAALIDLKDTPPYNQMAAVPLLVGHFLCVPAKAAEDHQCGGGWSAKGGISPPATSRSASRSISMVTRRVNTAISRSCRATMSDRSSTVRMRWARRSSCAVKSFIGTPSHLCALVQEISCECPLPRL